MSVATVEQILVIPTELFHRLGHFQGLSTGAADYLPELLRPEQVSFRPRPQMEEDPSFKQLIPYVIFRHVDAAGVERIFAYTRGGGQGEKRLHRKRSIGIGGHISSCDLDAGGDACPYQEGMRRELAEEVEIGAPYTARCVGLLNDDLTEVGRVHLGIVHVFDVERPAVAPREAEMLECGFVTPEELHAQRDELESWSQICLETLFPRRG